MNKAEAISEFIKILYISLISYFTYIKITDYKTINTKKNLIVMFECMCTALLYVTLVKYIYPNGAILMAFLILGLGMKIVLKNNNFTITYIMSVIITYVTYLISIIFAGLILKLLIPSISSQSNIGIVAVIVVETLVIFSVFKIKRIKKGLNFLKTARISNDVIIFTMFTCGVILLLFCLFQRINSLAFNTWLFSGIVLITVSLIAWIKTQITSQYRKNMRDRTIEIQKKEIDEQLRVIEDVKEENLRLAKVIHKYNNRLCALELGIKNTIEQNVKTEFAEELYCILKETEDLSKSFSKETTIENKQLPLTNIIGIDNMFKYMQKEANKSNINFSLNINQSINCLVEEIINKEKFETLIGDHLRDAIIAINKSNTSYKGILVVLGMVENCYEFSIYDTGIEFDIDVLMKLGLEPVTTGGTGIGFMTTFETLKECKASLIIEEYDTKTTNYTKSVTIRFDEKNEYRIRSYRADEIIKQNKGNRIIIEKI